MDSVAVYFAGVDKVFHVSKTLVEIPLPFTDNVLSIKWYGAIIAFGFALAVLFGGRRAWVWEISIDKMIDVLIYGTIGGIVGARLFFVFSQWGYYSQHPGDIIKIWEGGLAIYGGIIGGLICGFVVCKVEKLNIANLLDMVGMSLLIGQGIGRWGNYANQEAFGGFTNKNWGMMSQTVIDYITRYPEKFGIADNVDVAEYIAENNLYVHPTFFYESVWCLLGFVILYIILRKFRIFSGQLFLCYGVWYGLERAIVEGMRTDSLYIGSTNIRVSQLISICLVAVCGVLLIYMTAKRIKHPKPIEGVDYFPERTPEEQAVWDRRRAKREARKENRKKNKEYKDIVIREGKVVSRNDNKEQVKGE